MRRRKQTVKTSTVVLAVMGAFLLGFISVMIVTFWRFQSVPDTLIQCTMGAGGVEALLLAAIKVSKVLSERKSGKERNGESEEGDGGDGDG